MNDNSKNPTIEVLTITLLISRSLSDRNAFASDLTDSVPEIVVSFSYRKNEVLITVRNFVNSVIVGVPGVECSQSNKNDQDVTQADALG